ncbi:MAG: hypothetical protein FWD66_00695 [Paludibacter sp.]|nr:hypothetical protein [Paludibacter sp.]
MKKNFYLILFLSLSLTLSLQAQQRDVAPFEDDICGVWVSDLAYDQSTPYLVINIINVSDRYRATIMPYCTLAQEYGMYTGVPFKYSLKYNENLKSYFALSSVDSVYSDNSERAFFYFGNTKLEEGMNPEFAKLLINSIAVPLASLGTWGYLGGAVLGGLFALSTEDNSTNTTMSLNMQRLFVGCMDVNLAIKSYVAKTNKEGFKIKKSDLMQIRLYKLYPEDNILFAAQGNEFFGNVTFTEKETRQMADYKQLKTLKNRSNFNKQSYKKLSETINNYLLTRATTNPEFEQLAEDCALRLEKGAEGLSYRQFTRRGAILEGWVDKNGYIKGQGVYTRNNGEVYIGNFNRNVFWGEGTLTYRDTITNDVTTEYTGTFKNGQFNGEGTLTDAIGSMYAGTWKNGNPVQGTISYLNGDRFNGQCTFNKRTQKLEPKGKGTMVYADGQSAEGIWKNNEFITKK